MDGATEKIVGVIVGAIASGVVAYIISRGQARIVAAEEAGKHKAEFENLKIKVESQDEVLHDRINKMNAAVNQVLDKLDARSIELLEKNAELKGIILGMKHARGEGE